MKRDNLFTKLVALLLCALMVAAWLPNASIAVNADDFETDIDVVDPTEPAPTGPVYDEVLDNTRVALSMQDKINATFVYNNSAIKKKAYDRVYMVVHPAEVDAEHKEDVIVTEMVGGRYVYEYGVWSRHMADDLEVTLYAEKDGTVFCGKTITWSVQQGAMERVEQYIESNDPRATVFVNMLNFGAAMQQNNNYRLDDLANAKLTDAQKAYGTQEDPDLNVAVPTLNKNNYELRTIALYSGAETGLQMIFTMPSGFVASEYTVAVTVGGTTTEYPFSQTSSTRGILIFTKLSAKQMRDTVTVQLYHNGAPMNDLTYDVSIAAVAKLRADAGKTFAYDLMKYGDSVAANY